MKIVQITGVVAYVVVALAVYGAIRLIMDAISLFN